MTETKKERRESYATFIANAYMGKLMQVIGANIQLNSQIHLCQDIRRGQAEEDKFLETAFDLQHDLTNDLIHELTFYGIKKTAVDDAVKTITANFPNLLALGLELFKNGIYYYHSQMFALHVKFGNEEYAKQSQSAIDNILSSPSLSAGLSMFFPELGSVFNEDSKTFKPSQELIDDFENIIKENNISIFDDIKSDFITALSEKLNQLKVTSNIESISDGCPF